jgi:hypothetical protein
MNPSGVLDNGVSRFAAVLARAAGAPTALILLTHDGELLTLAGASGMPPEWPRPARTPSGNTLTGLVLTTGQPLVITDIRDDPACRTPPRPSTWASAATPASRSATSSTASSASAT